MANDLEKMTQKSQEAMQSAAELAENRSHSSVEPEHLFCALLSQEDGIVPHTFKSAGGNLKGLKKDVDSALEKLPQVTGEAKRVMASPKLVKVFQQAEKESKAMGDSYISTEHFAL